jgi:hypothetical protein
MKSSLAVEVSRACDKWLRKNDPSYRPLAFNGRQLGIVRGAALESQKRKAEKDKELGK